MSDQPSDAALRALEWLVHLCHDIGKAGGKPEPGEWEAAIEAGERALAERPPVAAPQCPHGENCACAISTRHEWFIAFCDERDKATSIHGAASVPASPPMREGTWEKDDPRRIFVEGASWWQFYKYGATKFPSERDEMEAEATRRFPPAPAVSPAPPTKEK